MAAAKLRLNRAALTMNQVVTICACLQTHHLSPSMGACRAISIVPTYSLRKGWPLAMFRISQKEDGSLLPMSSQSSQAVRGPFYGQAVAHSSPCPPTLHVSSSSVLPPLVQTSPSLAQEIRNLRKLSKKRVGE